MFKTLYKYIIGLNEDNKEIEMTRPGKNSSHAYTNFESTNNKFLLPGSTHKIIMEIWHHFCLKMV